jgi:hypothetical protein
MFHALITLSTALVLLVAALAPGPAGHQIFGDCPQWAIPYPGTRIEARTIVLSVNGMATPPLEEYMAVCNLGQAVASLGLTPGYAADPPVWVWGFKNRTRLEEVLDADRAVTARVVAETWISAQPFPPPADLWESRRQVHNIRKGFPHGARINPDSRALANLIRASVLDGRRVILVPHSQGNLLVHEALHLLASEVSAAEARKLMRCTAVVGLASPVSLPLRGDVVSTRLMARGDAIYSPVLRWLTGVRPTRTEIVTTSRSPAPGAEFRLSTLGTSVALHDVNASYFGQPETRGRIVAALDSVYGVMAERDCEPVADPNMPGAWSGPLGPAGEGTLRLDLTGAAVEGTWAHRGGGGRSVGVQLISRRHIRVSLAAPDTALGLYLVGTGATGYQFKVLDDTDEQQGGRLFLVRTR